MQRFWDLMMIGKGTLKVGEACAQSFCRNIEHLAKTSSITQPLMEKFDQVCGCGENENSKYFRLDQIKDADINFSDCEEPKLDLTNKTLSHSFSKESSPKSCNDGPLNGSTSKRHYSSQFYHNQNMLYFSRTRQCFHFNVKSFAKRYLHTSCIHCALTSEELAKLAKLKQLRKSKDKPKTESKPQTLNPQSRERKVPSSRVGRLSSFGGLAAGLAVGSIADYAKKSIGYVQDGATASLNASSLFNEANLNRIVSTLCTVRGAALKLGQMLSIQDSSVVDPKLLEVFDRVRQSADFMPASQMKKVLVKEFGENWRDLVKEFDEKPFAAASIGQVHRAVLHDGTEVAMKIQYPGVAESIDSDINNLVTLLKFWNVFPEQLFIDKFIDVARVELALECDYEREGEFSEKFRKDLQDEDIYGVPCLIPELSSKKVLTTELVSGLPIDQVASLEQDERNFVAAAVLQLVLRELFELRCMQTDPNWANFLYDHHQQKLWLLDFGAARYYSKSFVDQYIEIVKGASIGDRKTVLEISRSMGFLTGYESNVMEEAHIDAIMILGEPFSTEEVFDFSKQSTSNRIVKLIPTFMKHRLTPPPEESYSLHRKLSGAFLIAAKLKAQFACKKMFDNVYENFWKNT